jgi:hypothetical protein
MFLFHPVILRTLFSCFSCIEIEDGEYWLEDEQGIRCWCDEHKFYSLFISLPGLGAWGVVFPIAILVFLLTHKTRLDDADTKINYGFLLHGYRPQRFFWEFVILYRKVLMTFIVVFLSEVSITMQGLLAFFVLMLALLLQIVHEPFAKDFLNWMELYSIITAGTMIY